MLKLCSWNVCGVREKLNDPEILKFLMQYDLVWLLEVKSAYEKSVPGFYMYNNKSRVGCNRGGVMLLIKCALMQYVTNVNMEEDDMIWVNLSVCKDVKFGGVYIPPEDSLYCEASPFRALSEMCLNTRDVVVLGDFNARVGSHVLSCGDGSVYRYDGVKDPVVNSHGRMLRNMCRSNNMVVMNHLNRKGTTLGGDLSFRRGSRWTSEIDLCVVTSDCVRFVSSVEVNKSVKGSDHAPICVDYATKEMTQVSPTELLERANGLGESYRRIRANESMWKSPRYDTVNLHDFSTELLSLDPPNPDAVSIENISEAFRSSSEIIHEAARRNRCGRLDQQEETWDRTLPRWRRILETNDAKFIWKAINWSGNIDTHEHRQPEDDQLKTHFESLLNNECHTNSIRTVCIDDSTPTIPVLDEPFTVQELVKVLKDVNVRKSYVGICPGIMRALPVNWIMFFLHMFNVVFLNVCYPVSWGCSKLFVLFKGGKDRLECGNYRGISIMNTLAKLYDYLILNRLKLWTSIDKCQAGAQSGRGCVEQIMTLRLLCDLANYKKKKLYMLFIDYSKAYDRVPRGKLLELLKSRGCGKVMLRAIQAMYSCTQSVLRSATIDATVGVRQGSPSSCLLFTIYMDEVVRMINRCVDTDGFLGKLHTLLLMDDMVILATSKEMCVRKLTAVLDYCQEYGMVLNEKKTKLMVVRGTDEDRLPLTVRNIKIDCVHKYLYLGAWICDDAKMNTVLDLHETVNEMQLNKFAIFCAANNIMPYTYKRKVFDAAVTSALLYSSETWLTNNPRKIIVQYNRAVKNLLGVRKFTSPDMCLIESGIPPVLDVIAKRRRKFLESKLREPNVEEPFYVAFELCRVANTPGYQFVMKALQYRDNVNPLDIVKMRIREKPETASKYVAYRSVINPELSVHPVYVSNEFVPDYKRQALTRLRLMSHDLKIETGRRNGIPAELRLCMCDSNAVQDESHVLLNCSLSRDCRARYNMLDFSSFTSLMKYKGKLGTLCDYVCDVLKLYG